MNIILQCSDDDPRRVFEMSLICNDLPKWDDFIEFLSKRGQALENVQSSVPNTKTKLECEEWCAPVVIVPKSDGNVRIYADLVELNKNVTRELHPLPKAEYSLNLLAGAKMFSKLDSNFGFWQIPLDKKSSYLTTFISFGQRLPFDISTAPEHFQRRMSQMLEGKELFAADTLSRNPQKVSYKREELEVEIDVFIQMITSSLRASPCRLDELRAAQLKDETCQKLSDYVLKGWPSKKEVDTLCTHHIGKTVMKYQFKMDCCCRIIIPKSHQAEVLNQIHEGQLGIAKSRARARCSVYWPGISRVIEEKIRSCTACIKRVK
ncbi:hypothetical protein AVEN_64107-1 [Araneus ventricosus]|uniref:RNA-directed DNA polymerase n=1 Tax=Araneus ventricosus TaxID=182803 RepID=A0A4Y2C4M8_ARAVE|nr:hypothetical protein AVEN_64107-1 [Araneus ventricosus]